MSFKLSHDIERMQKSAILSVNREVQRMERDGIKVHKLHIGDTKLPSPKGLRQVAIEALRQDMTKYAGVAKGILEVREKISDFHRRHDSIDIDPENIILTYGGEGALFTIANTFLEEGEDVVITKPAWEMYTSCFTFRTNNIRRIPMFAPNWVIDKDDALDVVTKGTRIVVLNFPNNPTGKLLSEHEIRKTLLEALFSNAKLIVDDQAYRKYVFDNKKYSSIAGFSELTPKSIIVGSLSKPYAITGLRLGYLAIPNQYDSAKKAIDKMEDLERIKDVCLSLPYQFILQHALEEYPEIELERNERILEESKRRRDYVVKRLREMELQVYNPDGGLYVYPNVKLPSRQFADYLLQKHHIAVCPGDPFEGEQSTHVRITFAAYSPQEMAPIMDTFEQALKNYGRYTGR